MKKINRIAYLYSVVFTLLLTSVSVFTIRSNEQVGLKKSAEKGILAWKYRPSRAKQYIKLSKKQTPLPDSVKDYALFKHKNEEEDSDIDEEDAFNFQDEDFSKEVLNGYNTMFPALAKELSGTKTSIKELIKVFVSVANKEVSANKYEPLSWCTCKPVGVRIMLTLSFLNDIIAKDKDKTKRLVHTDLSEELGLQSYLLMLGLLKLGYKNIHFNFVNIQDISETIKVFGQTLQKRLKIDDDAIEFDSNDDEQQSSFKVDADDIEIVVTGYGQGVSKYLDDIKQKKAFKSHSFALVDPYRLALEFGFNRELLEKYLSKPEKLTDDYYDNIKQLVENELEEVAGVVLVLFDDKGKRDLVFSIDPMSEEYDDEGKKVGLFVLPEGGTNVLTTDNKKEIYEKVKEVCQDWYDKGEEAEEDELFSALLEKVAKKYKMHIFPFDYMDQMVYKEAFYDKTLDENLNEANSVISSLEKNDDQLTTLNELYFIGNDASYVISLFMPGERKPWVEVDGKDSDNLMKAINEQITSWWEKKEIKSKKEFIVNIIDIVEDTENTRIFVNAESRDIYDINKNHKQAQKILDSMIDKDEELEGLNGLIFRSTTDEGFMANIFFESDSSLYYSDSDSEAAVFAKDIDDIVSEWKKDQKSISRKELVLKIFKEIKARKDMLFIRLGDQDVDEGKETEYSMLSSISHYDAFDELVRKTHADKHPIIYILDKWYPNLPGKYELVGAD